MATTAVVAPPIAVNDTAIELFTPVAVAKFDLVARGLVGLQRTLAAVTITDQASANDMQKVLAESKRGIKTANDTRLAQTKELRDQVADINTAWKPLEDALEQVAKTAERKIIAFNQAQREAQAKAEAVARAAAVEAQRKQAEAEAKAAAARTDSARQKANQAAADAEAELQVAREQEAEAEAAQNVRGIRTESGTSTSQWPWTFEVVELAEVPREYLMLDEPKVRAAIKAGTLAIPGLAIYQQERLRTTTR